MSSFALKQRYIARTQMKTAGKANKNRRDEPTLWSLIGWDRDETEIPVSRPATIQTVEEPSNQNTWESESRASFIYFAKPETITRQFKDPIDPEVLKTQRLEQRRRFSLVAVEAASKAETKFSESKESKSKSKSSPPSSSSSSFVTRKAKANPSNLGQARKVSKKPLRRKKKRAPKVEGPKPTFFTYGMNNTSGVNRMRTHNVLPEDPREIYPNALHAAVRHPNPAKAAMAIKKAEFLKSHQDSVSAAAEELLTALAKDAKEAETSIKAMKKGNQEKKSLESKTNVEEKSEPPARRNQISNPISDPSLTMWDLLAWPGSTTVEGKSKNESNAISSAETAAIAAVPAVKKSTKATRSKMGKDILPTKPSSVLFVERSKRSPSGSRRITASSGGLRKVTIEEIEAFEKFEPQKIEIVDPKSFANLSPAWTKNIPTAGKKSPERVPIPL
jgi:hypothetical protein